jgi:hypothetical protein
VKISSSVWPHSRTRQLTDTRGQLPTDRSRSRAGSRGQVPAVAVKCRQVPVKCRQCRSRAGRCRSSAGSRGQEPAGAGQEPAGAGQEPASAGQEPAGAGQVPASAGQEPAGAGQEPAGVGQEPASAGQEPASAGQEPAGVGQEPAACGPRTDTRGDGPTIPVNEVFIPPLIAENHWTLISGKLSQERPDRHSVPLRSLPMVEDWPTKVVGWLKSDNIRRKVTDVVAPRPMVVAKWTVDRHQANDKSNEKR